MATSLGDRGWLLTDADSCLNLTREDWTRPDLRRLDQTRPGDLKTPDEYQRRLDQTRPGDLKTPDEYQRRLDQTRPGDLKTPDEYQLLYRPDQMKALKDINMKHVQLPDDPVLTGRNLSKPDEMSVCSCPDWEKPVMMENQTKPDKSWRVQQTRRHSEVKNVNWEDWNEREEQPDFYRPSCVKEDGEV
ncbi:hypothetical protein Bbelb_068230 [Branchiostoma belcheri]|nr:hypothetical protein Bbelb_068230 [Branchiostoma belcheri]